MILKLFKSNHPFVIFLIPLIGLAFWFPSLLSVSSNVSQVNAADYPFLYQWIYRLISPYPILFNIIGLIMIILQSYILIRMNFKFIFSEQKTYLSSVLFVMLSSALVRYQTLHPALIANFFLLFAIDRAFLFEKNTNQFKRYFESGIFIGLGSLFYPSLVYYLITIWLTLFILRTFNWREWMSSLVGLITPWVFYFIILLLNNSHFYPISDYLEFYTNNTLYLTVSLPAIIATITIAFILVIALLSGMGNVTNKKISTRKYFNLFFLFLLNCIGVTLLSPSVGFETIVILAVPASMLLGAFLMDLKSKWVGELFFDLLLVAVVTMIWIH